MDRTTEEMAKKMRTHESINIKAKQQRRKERRQRRRRWRPHQQRKERESIKPHLLSKMDIHWCHPFGFPQRYTHSFSAHDVKVLRPLSIWRRRRWYTISHRSTVVSAAQIHVVHRTSTQISVLRDSIRWCLRPRSKDIAKKGKCTCTTVGCDGVDGGQTSAHTECTQSTENALNFLQEDT